MLVRELTLASYIISGWIVMKREDRVGTSSLGT